MSAKLSDRAPPLPAEIFQPISLPCGKIMQNRLVKAAMYEHLASFHDGFPNKYHFQLYSEWAKHGWGMIVTGNVQVAKDHLTLGRDLVLPESLDVEEFLVPFRILAASIHGVYQPSISGASTVERNGTLAIMQLNHPGRQSSNFLGGRLPFRAPLAPSAIPLVHGKDGFLSTLMNMAMFQTPRIMSEADILSVIDRFVDGAILAFRTGFDGVQLHAAHGYLLAQFLSDKTNKRQDAYSLCNALNMIRLIVERIRMFTSKDFAICVKISADNYCPADSADPSFESRALEHLVGMASWGSIDVIEISGGDYEKPDFMTSSRTSPRQAFFTRFSRQAVKSLNSLRDSSTLPLPLILLTGGLRTPALLCSVLSSNDADLLGIGRGSILCPSLPSILRIRLRDMQTWGNVPFRSEPLLQSPRALQYQLLFGAWWQIPEIRLIGAGMTMAWYVVAMRQIAYGIVPGCILPACRIGSLPSVFWMWAWTPSDSTIGALNSKNQTRYYSLPYILLVSIVMAYIFNTITASN